MNIEELLSELKLKQDYTKALHEDLEKWFEEGRGLFEKLLGDKKKGRRNRVSGNGLTRKEVRDEIKRLRAENPNITAAEITKEVQVTADKMSKSKKRNRFACKTYFVKRKTR